MSKCNRTVDMVFEPVLDLSTNTNLVSRRPNGTLRVDLVGFEKTLTQQSFKDMTDVNLIMKRWLSGGAPPVSDASKAVFKDVSQSLDYREVIERVMDVQDAFDALPADMRFRFKNDPALLLDFVSDPANTKECESLGLIDDFGNSARVDSSVAKPDQSAPEQLPLDVTVRTDTTVVS